MIYSLSLAPINMTDDIINNEQNTQGGQSYDDHSGYSKYCFHNTMNKAVSLSGYKDNDKSNTASINHKKLFSFLHFGRFIWSHRQNDVLLSHIINLYSLSSIKTYGSSINQIV